jgi:hypothetical protein
MWKKEVKIVRRILMSQSMIDALLVSMVSPAGIININRGSIFEICT